MEKVNPDAVYPDKMKPGDPEAQKHPEKGKLIRYVAGEAKYFTDMTELEQKDILKADPNAGPSKKVKK